jgi:hypothetical protein
MMSCYSIEVYDPSCHHNFGFDAAVFNLVAKFFFLFVFCWSDAFCVEIKWGDFRRKAGN